MTTRRCGWLLASAVLLACGDTDHERGEDTVPVREGGVEQALAADAQANSDAADDAASTTVSDASMRADASGQVGTPDGSIPEPTPGYKLDCGSAGIALESAGPPKNRVNYVIVGDGYTEAELETTYVKHLQEMLRVRFLPESELHTRYRKFVNICALKVPSPRSGIGETRGDSAFGGYGNDESRLGYVQEDKVRAAITRLLPATIEVDWTAIVLNSNRWWNAGGRYMVWSGAHKDAGLAAIHEGGHSFENLADEYGGNCTFSGREADMRINVTRDAAGTAGKWSKWLDYTHTPGTGKQGVFEGAQYCDKGAYRPTQDSVMNSLWRSSYFNAISREQGVRGLYAMVRPIDDSTPLSTSAPGVLTVTVVDPAVIQVEWFVDGAQMAAAKGPRFDVAALKLSAGTHKVRARAFDNTDWVRGDRTALEQTLTWNIQVP